MHLDIRESDFPPSLENLRIQHIVLYFVRADGVGDEVPVSHLHFTPVDGAQISGSGAHSINGLISTRGGNAGNWGLMTDESPVGDWELALTDPLDDGRMPDELFRQGEISDILFVITYSGNTPYWFA